MTARLVAKNGLQDTYPNFMTNTIDIFKESVYNLEGNGIQPHYIRNVMNEEDILSLPLHFRKISTNL